ncbi:MAG: flagellar hook assembly protein FlgD [Parasulfuritortus sp.]|jgi:flagellar basal-body rod modification protein FlgD|nr:flagellar hook assembly protein FlgD [Parasulfuritortus sp.]
MTVSSTTSNAALVATLNGTSGTSTSAVSSSLSDVQTSFLKLLTTQLQNQDPTNPMDNSQMTTQLAQMSTAQGISDLNTTLNSLLSSYQSTQTLQAASLIGHQVLADGNSLVLSNSQAVGAATLASAADTVNVQILDANGQVVRNMSLGAQSSGLVSFQWDGKNDQGQVVADGNYSTSITASSGATAVTATPLALASVSSVSLTGGALKVNTSGLGQLDLSQIQQIF